MCKQLYLCYSYNFLVSLVNKWVSEEVWFDQMERGQMDSPWGFACVSDCSAAVGWSAGSRPEPRTRVLLWRDLLVTRDQSSVVVIASNKKHPICCMNYCNHAINTHMKQNICCMSKICHYNKLNWREVKVQRWNRPCSAIAQLQTITITPNYTTKNQCLYQS